MRPGRQAVDAFAEITLVQQFRALITVSFDIDRCRRFIVNRTPVSRPLKFEPSE